MSLTTLSVRPAVGPCVTVLLSIALSTPALAQTVAFPLAQTIEGEPWAPGDLEVFSSSLLYLAPYAQSGGAIFLVGSTAATGHELYRFDRARGAVELVADIRPGSNGSRPLGFTAVEDILLFHAETDEEGRELYRTDGTAAGTHRIVLNPGPAPAFNFQSSFSKHAIFGAFGHVAALSVDARGRSSVTHCLALYDVRSDSLMVLPNVQQPSQVLQYNGDLYVVTKSQELFRITSAGQVTKQANDIPWGFYRVINDRLFVSGGGDVAFVDPLTGGVELVYDYMGFTTLSDTTTWTTNDTTYFINSHNDFGLSELWRTDGTAVGTVCLNVEPGSSGSPAESYVSLPEGLYGLRSIGFNSKPVRYDIRVNRFVDLGLSAIGGFSSKGVAWDGTFIYEGRDPGILYQYTPGHASSVRLSNRLGSTSDVGAFYSDGDYLLTRFYGDDDLTAVLYARECGTLTDTLNLTVCPGDSIIYRGRPLSAGARVNTLIPVLRNCDTLYTVLVGTLDTLMLDVWGPDTVLRGQIARYESANGLPVTWPDGSTGLFFDLTTDNLALGTHTFIASAIDPVSGCSSAFTVRVEIVQTSGLSTVAPVLVRVSPNPATEAAYLHNFRSGTKWTLFDTQGHLVAHGTTADLSLQQVSSGIYMIRVQDGVHTSVTRLVVY